MWKERRSEMALAALALVFGGCGRVTRDDSAAVGPPAEPGTGGAPEEVPKPVPKPRAMGGACAPLNELDPEFSGFSLDEVWIDENTPACVTGTCVIQGFQGRVSCPYGQASSEGNCRVPGTGEPVLVAVEPQVLSRPPALGAVCSCHCAGPGPGPYCVCPKQMQCTHVVDDLGFGRRELAGSYCLPKGARYVRGSVDPSVTCNSELADCEL